VFTGIVEDMGTIAASHLSDRGGTLCVSSPVVAQDTKVGDSIAVCGACLTVRELAGATMTVDVMPETMRSTVLSGLKRSTPVNLERAMPASGRFGGHIVTGHVDVVGTVKHVRSEGNARWMCVSLPDTRLVADKGSITLDGVSLTVSSVEPHGAWVSLVPHTLTHTTLGLRHIGDRVNVEYDIIARYCERILAQGGPTPTMEMLEQNGF
jgi:riboflavin synthase